MKKLLVIAAAMFVAGSALAFTPGEAPADVAAEVAKLKAQKQTPEQIAKAAAAAGLSESVVFSAMQGSFGLAATVTAMVEAKYDAAQVVNTAIDAGGKVSDMQSAAIAGGAAPGLVTGATGSGGNNNNNNNNANNGLGGGFSGDTGGSQSHTGAVGGSGNTSSSNSASKS